MSTLPMNPGNSPTAAKVQESSDEWPADVAPPAMAPITPTETETHQQAWAKYPGVPVEMENSIGMKFRVMPPSEFLMGSSEQDPDRESKSATEKHMLEWHVLHLPFEGPQHRVTLIMPFGISIHEVTRRQFRQFVDDTGYKTDAGKDGEGGEGYKNGQLSRGPEFLWNTSLGFKPPQSQPTPVAKMSANDAEEFCKWLSKKEGLT